MREDALAALAADESFIGWTYSIDYDTALVMTNDAWKHSVGGVPQNCFLVAAPFQQSNYGDAPADSRTAVLLRVVGTASLPLADDMLRTRIDHLQRQRGQLVDQLDAVTAKQLQTGGLHCHVLGTFFRDDEGSLRLGSDIETFSVAESLMVFRPRREALHTIVNYIDPDSARQAIEQISRAQRR